MGMSKEKVNSLWATVIQEAVSRNCDVSSALVREVVDGVSRKDGNIVPRSEAVIGVFLSSGTQFWHTPDWLLEEVRGFLGGCIDLDPCSDEHAQARVQARYFYTEEQDGLDRLNAWFGNMFVNPAFGMRLGKSLQGLFLERAIEEHVNNPAVGNIVLLLKSSVGYKWLTSAYAYPICFLSKKIAFHSLCGNTTNANPHGSILVFIGSKNREADFCRTFSQYGYIPGWNMWSFDGADKPHNSSAV